MSGEDKGGDRAGRPQREEGSLLYLPCTHELVSTALLNSVSVYLILTAALRGRNGPRGTDAGPGLRGRVRSFRS